MSVHLGESAEESELLATGTGPWRACWSSWRVARRLGDPGCGPVEYLDGLGVIDERPWWCTALQFDDAALARLAALGPARDLSGSNQWVGRGHPPIERFLSVGVGRGHRHRQPGQRRGVSTCSAS